MYNERLKYQEIAFKCTNFNKENYSEYLFTIRYSIYTVQELIVLNRITKPSHL